MLRELTYFAPRKCYKKKRSGQTYYVGHGSGADTDANYKRAWKEWEAKLSGLVEEERGARVAAGMPRLVQIVANNEPLDADELEGLGLKLDRKLAQILRRQRAEGTKDLNAEELRYATGIVLNTLCLMPSTVEPVPFVRIHRCGRSVISKYFRKSF